MTIQFYDDVDDDLLIEELGEAIETGKRLGILNEEEE